VAHRLKAGEKFEQAGFMRRTVAEIGRNGFDEPVAVVMYQIEQGIQPGLPFGARNRCATTGCGVHGVELTAEGRGLCDLG
jgi:hypothetical protein